MLYPSDSNQVGPDRYLTVDYSNPGQIVEFDRPATLQWRIGRARPPSLALPLPNGDILLNDDFNHRVSWSTPLRNRIVWQYGQPGSPGARPGT